MTALELAEKVATAALYTQGDIQARTQAVLYTLRKYDCWFCRLHSTPGGDSMAENEQPMEFQPELFT